jgi:glycosyltransferase involved in cell wall biosynthesis
MNKTIAAANSSAGDDQHAPLVSVVTATFNALDDLKQTVESVSSQESASVEHVVIDGGSRDGTRAYLEGLGERVRWVSEPDDGIADALNKGVAMARGDYILVLQAGDCFVSPQSFTMAKPTLSQGADLVSFDVRLVNGPRSRVLRSHGLGPRAELFMPLPHQGLFAARTLIERIGAFDTTYRIAMDYEFLLRAKRAGAVVKIVNQTLATMPETGISTRPHWRDMKVRLAENRRLHLQHAGGPLAKLGYQLFWASYRPFKRVKAALSNVGADG